MLKIMKSTIIIRTEVTNKKTVKKELKKYGIKNYIEGLEPYKNGTYRYIVVFFEGEKTDGEICKKITEKLGGDFTKN